MKALQLLILTLYLSNGISMASDTLMVVAGGTTSLFWWSIIETKSLTIEDVGEYQDTYIPMRVLQHLLSSAQLSVCDPHRFEYATNPKFVITPEDVISSEYVIPKALSSLSEPNVNISLRLALPFDVSFGPLDGKFIDKSIILELVPGKDSEVISLYVKLSEKLLYIRNRLLLRKGESKRLTVEPNQSRLQIEGIIASFWLDDILQGEPVQSVKFDSRAGVIFIIAKHGQGARIIDLCRTFILGNR